MSQPSLKKLENWLASWQRADGAYNGPIATFWESTLDTTQANSVHQAPIIRGYLNLYTKTHNAVFLERAVQAANFLVQDLDGTHHFANTASDVPRKLGGPIQDIECNLGLLALYEHRGKLENPERYLQTVLTNTNQYLLKRWMKNRVLSHGVANQIAKSGELFLWLYRLTQDTQYLSLATAAGDWLVQHQLKSGPLQGGMEQSQYDSRLLLIYQAPCLPLLVALHTETKNPIYHQAAQKLWSFIESGRLEGGGYIGLYEQSLLIKLINYLSRRVLLFRSSGLALKRWLLNSNRANQWLKRTESPNFIARSAEIILNLMSFGTPPALTTQIDWIWRHQLPSGGVMNWLGENAAQPDAQWAAYAPATRWNAFVFELATSVLQGSDYPVELSVVPASTYPIANLGHIIESQDYLGLLNLHSVEPAWAGLYRKSSSTANLALPPRKVLLVTPIFPPETGGCASRMHDFAEFLDPNQWQPIVLTDTTTKTPEQFAYSVHRIPLFISLRKWSRLFSTIGSIRQIVKDERVDVILTTIPAGLHAFAATLAAKWLKVPLVLDIRDPWIEGELYTGSILTGSWKHRLGTKLEAYLVRQADAVTSVYKSVATHLIEKWNLDSAKVHWLPNGINHTLASTQPPLDLSPLNGKTLFLYQGLIARPQAVDRIFQYIPQILEQIPEAVFVFIGDGESKPELQRQADGLPFKDRLIFKERVSRSEITAWIGRADYGLVTLGDKFEYAIPSKLFDYLAFGKPIVAVVPQNGESDRLLAHYQVGLNLVTTQFQPLPRITRDNPIFKDYDRRTNAKRLSEMLGLMFLPH